MPRQPSAEPKSVEAYSLPTWMHERIREEAESADQSRSAVLRKAVRMYFESLDAARRLGRTSA